MLPLLIQVFDLYGVGLRQGCSTPNLVKELDFKVDKLSTGDSLDITPQDVASIVANDVVIKDIVCRFEMMVVVSSSKYGLQASILFNFELQGPSMASQASKLQQWRFSGEMMKKQR
ncbi:hypothetical protein E3N88_25489 [Mikania micrantha]|uniref:Uncharacterized protein n=1 Tax=Mikania micrantha TaxID=192012 RepID=A0A5N6N7P1_9ASTR|nr:hypothetical protein E3N88_25489 [Mikania micrantha]